MASHRRVTAAGVQRQQRQLPSLPLLLLLLACAMPLAARAKVVDSYIDKDDRRLIPLTEAFGYAAGGTREVVRRARRDAWGTRGSGLGATGLGASGLPRARHGAGVWRLRTALGRRMGSTHSPTGPGSTGRGCPHWTRLQDCAAACRCVALTVRNAMLRASQECWRSPSQTSWCTSSTLQARTLI
eukprot:345483-Chlamydomonas_euryale.AAC.3